MIKSGILTAGIAAAAIALSSGAAMAAGDAAAGEKVAKKCVACHTFEQGGANKVGPNLWGTVDKLLGTHEGYDYSDSYVQLGEAGVTWTVEELTAYLKDPKKYVRAKLDDNKAKSKMTFKLRKDDEIADIIAYMATLK